MYYRISIFQKTAISILDTNVRYIACLLPLRSRIALQWRARARVFPSRKHSYANAFFFLSNFEYAYVTRMTVEGRVSYISDIER